MLYELMNKYIEMLSHFGYNNIREIQYRNYDAKEFEVYIDNTLSNGCNISFQPQQRMVHILIMHATISGKRANGSVDIAFNATNEQIRHILEDLVAVVARALKKAKTKSQLEKEYIENSFNKLKNKTQQS